MRAWKLAVPFTLFTLLAAACGGQTAEPDDPAPADPGDATEPADPGDATEPADPEEARGTVRVGLAMALTGVFAGLGEDQRDGFTLYVDQQGGQLAGYDIELIEGDTQSDATLAIEAVERLIDSDEVDVIVGIQTTAEAYAVAPVVPANIPVIVSSASANDITQRQRADNIFRVLPSSSQFTKALGEYVCQEMGLERAAIVALDFGFGWESMGGFARTYQENGCDVIQETYGPIGTEDWSPFVAQLDRGADVIAVTLTGPDTVRFLQAYRDAGLTIPLVGVGTLTDPSNLEQAQMPVAEGFVTTLHTAETLDNPVMQEFISAFEDTYGRFPGLYAEGAYEAAMFLEAALEGVSEVTSEALMAAIPEARVENPPRGRPIFLDDYGNNVTPMYVRVLEEVDGRWANTVQHVYEEIDQFWPYDADEYLEFPPYEDLRGTWQSD